MRLTAMMAMAAVMGTAAVKENGERVMVYVDDDAAVSCATMMQARGVAKKMFAGIGVEIALHFGRPVASQRDAIAIELVTDTPNGRLPGALAYALPYEGVHIQIFWDRIRGAASPAELLAHVMVHEITHILEGVARHSATGIMKARWDQNDFIVMRMMPLPFAPEDVDLIHQGLSVRNSHAVAQVSRPDMTPAAVQIAGN